MEFEQVLKSRRSIRKYKPGQSISKEMVEHLIEAAILAPSWKNSQTARYYTVITPEMVEKIRIQCLPEFNQNNSKNAQALIVTAFEKNRSGFTRDGQAENEVGNGWGCYDLGLQNENLVLKAAELGLGTLIMGIRDSENLRKILSIPDSQELVSVIAVGYPDIEPDMPKRKMPEDIVKFY